MDRKSLTFAVVLATGAVVAGGAIAQKEAVTFPAGSLVEPGGGQVLKILGCKPQVPYGWMQCEVVQWENGGPTSQTITMDAADILAGVNRVRASGGQSMLTAAQARAGAATMGAPASLAAATRPQGAAAALTGECPRTSYGGPTSGTERASPALFQRKIADLYTMQTRAPYWYGVTFERFSVGAPIRNTVGAVPGAGAMRVNTGAPPNAAMYPVSSTYVVCEQSPGQAERRRIVNTHLCFVSRNNEWTCGGGGGPPPAITRLR
jgi:hypothetical protein